MQLTLTSLAVRRVAVVGGLIALASFLAWVASGYGYFWPRWVWFGLAVPAALVAALIVALRYPLVRPKLAAHAALSVVLAGAEVVSWALSRMVYFWPIWPLIAHGVALAVHAWVLPGPATKRERALVDRVATLTTTRTVALDAQATELRRVERDLHDGAQARLVSVGMTLGLAEELLAQDPSTAAELLAEARTSTVTALEELRSVMRGIQPPVLADRGFQGAVEALALDIAIPVEVRLEVPVRVPAPLESAAYFAVAECLANAVKHSQASRVWITGALAAGRLTVVCIDDGCGGANLDAGSGLAGIARRLAALDGTVAVDSPPGGPTTITLEVPCELSSPRT